MLRLSATLMLKVVLVASAVATAQAATGDRCSVDSSKMIGVLIGDGHCQSFAPGFAAKYLRVDTSQCTPPPQKGIEIAGRCIADDQEPLPPQVMVPNEPNILLAIQTLNDSLRQLRAELRAQSADIEWLRSQIDELRDEIKR